MLVLMASLPFLQPWHELPLTSFYAEWLAAVCGLLGMLFLLPRPAASPLLIPGITAAPLALMALALLQVAADQFAYGASGVLLALYLLWAAALAVTGRTLAAAMGTAPLLVRLAWALAAGGMVSALFGLLQYVGWWPAFGGLISTPQPVADYGVFGNLSQQNHFATYEALALAACAYLALADRLALRWAIAAAMVLLAALALSGSRSMLLYLAWMLAAAFLLLPLTGRLLHLRRWLLMAVLVMLVAVTVLATVARISPTALGPQLTRLVSPQDGAFGPRMFYWSHALRMFIAHPWLGVGFDGFALQLEAQLTAPAPFAVDQYAHNLPLQLMAAAGLPGLVALAVPVLLLVVRLYRQPRTMERLFVCGALGILLIHSMLEQPLYYAYFLGLAALFAGIADPSGRPLRANTVATLALVAMLVVAIKTARDHGAIREQFEGGEAAADVALRTRTLHHLRSFSLLAPLSELIGPEVFVPGDAPAAARRALNERVLRFAPTDEVAFRHAALLAEEGRMKDAQAQLQRAALAYPLSAPDFVARIDALAAVQPAVYGALAAYGHQLVRPQ
ncbi:hypothetical protein GCM10027277_26760 [Pseudoduganella ginsengisoli]